MTARPRARTPPERVAARRPTQGLVTVPTTADMNAPVRSMPSMPMLITATRSHKTPDRAPKAIGTNSSGSNPLATASQSKTPTMTHMMSILPVMSVKPVVEKKSMSPWIMGAWVSGLCEQSEFDGVLPASIRRRAHRP